MRTESEVKEYIDLQRGYLQRAEAMSNISFYEALQRHESINHSRAIINTLTWVLNVPYVAATKDSITDVHQGGA